MTQKISSNLGIYETQWVNRQPENIDFLRPNGFRFLIQTLPGVTYFCQAANIPEMSLGVATQSTPLVDIPRPGEKITYGSLTVRFMIQEDLKNYMELYNWMIGLGFPENHYQYTKFNESQLYRFPSSRGRTDGTEYSDATLIVLDSNNLPNAKFDFFDCFPISLSGMDFDVASGSTQHFQGTAVFKYRHFSMESLLPTA